MRRCWKRKECLFKQHDHWQAALTETEEPWTGKCRVIETPGIEATQFWVRILDLLLTHCVASLDLSSFVRWELCFVPYQMVVRMSSACSVHGT